MRIVRAGAAVVLLSACADPYQPPAGDLDPPEVAASSPADGEGGVGRLPEIRITFTEPVIADAGAVRLLGPDGPLAGTVTAEGSDLVLVPEEQLREGARHRVVVGQGVRDHAGNPLASDGAAETAYAFTFDTAAVPPEVLSVSPADGASDVVDERPATPVVIAFSEPMDERTIDIRNIVVRDGLSALPGTIRCEGDCTEAIFEPSASYRENRLYAVEIAAAAADASGIPMAAPFRSTFTTAVDLPEVIGTQPARGAVGVAIDLPEVVFQLSEALDPATVQPWNVTVEPAVPYQVSYDEVGHAVHVAFGDALVSATGYVVTLRNAVADDDGYRMETDAALSFRTAEIPDTNAPAPIEDLRFVTSRRTTLSLLWTSPGDDVDGGSVLGAPVSYEIRRSPTPILDEAAFAAAEPVASALSTRAGGQTEQLDLEVPLHDAWHYAVRAVDDGGHAVLSNDILAGIFLGDDRSSWGTAEGARAGSALALGDLDGDGAPDLAVGEPGHDRVQIFFGGGGRLVQELVGPAGSGFGSSLAAGDVDGDGAAELLVGAPLEDGERGAAYRYGGDFSEPQDWMRGGASRDRLGTAVAILGTELLAGAPGAGDGSEGEVWRRAGGRIVIVPGAQPGEAYGSALAIGDFDGDGVTDLAVGAPGHDLGAGRVEVRTGATAFSLPGTGRFGTVLAAGDLNADGTDELLVGAPFDDVGELADAGSASIFRGPIDPAGEPWSASGTAADARYGSALAVCGPLLDATGNALLIGAPGGTGLVEIHHGVPGGKFGERVDVLEGGAPFDAFGTALAPLGDLDGDGLEDLAIGAPGADRDASNPGRVHVLH